VLPGCLRACVTRLNGYSPYRSPPTMASTLRVRGSSATKAACGPTAIAARIGSGCRGPSARNVTCTRSPTAHGAASFGRSTAGSAGFGFLSAGVDFSVEWAASATGQ
jgi:hypothetical protein